MKIRRVLIPALLLLPALAQAGDWARSGTWNDGRAEVAVYDSERVIDGKPRAFKEHLLTEKDNSGPKKTSVFKLKQVIDVELKNYSRHYLTTVVTDGESARDVMKIVESVQDWTGNVLTSFTVGDWAVEKDDYFDDQLPLTLRTLPFKDGIEKKIRLFELHNGTSTTVTPAQMSVTLAADPVRCRAGSLPCWIVTIKKPAGTDRYWFEKKEPNLLVKMETADGRKRLLIGRARWTYWDHRIPRPKILN